MSESTERPPRRFRIKIARWATTSPIVLADAARPAFLGQYRTLDAACLAMDNVIRRERGLPSRVAITRAEILEAMDKRYANLVEGKTAAVRPAEMPPTLIEHVGVDL